MKNSYSCMYLVPIEIYEKLLECLDSNDVKTVNDLNRNDIGNDDGAFPNLPPPPPFFNFGNNMSLDSPQLSPALGPSNGLLPEPPQNNLDHPTPGSSNQILDSSETGQPQQTPSSLQDDNQQPSPHNLTDHYVCSLCNERFTLLSLLVTHRQEKHPTIQPIVTSQALQTANTPSASTQSSHDKYICSKCKERFSSVALLIEHLKGHYTLEKPGRSLIVTSQPNIIPESQNTSQLHQPVTDGDIQSATSEKGSAGRVNEVFRFSASSPKITVRRQKGKRVHEKERRKLVKPSETAKRVLNERYDSWSKRAKSEIDSDDYHGEHEVLTKKTRTVSVSSQDDDDDDVVFVPRPATQSHDDIAVEICKLCNANFNEKKTLIRHVKHVHGADMNYNQFDSQGVKRKTMSSVETAKSAKKTPQYLYKCQLCTSLFVKENALDRHVKNYHGANKNYEQIEAQGVKRKLNNFTCTLCVKSYKSQGALDKHVNLTHNMKMSKSNSNFQCKKCSKIFKSKKSLNNHSNSCHRQNDKTLRSNYERWK